MPRTTKNPQREDEDDERYGADAPRVDDVEPEDRAQSKLGDEVDEERVDGDDEELAEEIDIEDLAAMEGPDA